MKILVSLIFVFLLLGLWVNHQSDNQQPSMSGTPWHIEPVANYRSKVFGMTLGDTTLADARQALGPGYELAILQPAKADAGLEMYYARYHAGPIIGKLIVVAAVDVEQLQMLQERAIKVSTLQNGTRQYTFGADVEDLIDSYPVQSLTFIPTINLDADLVIERFGQPQRIINIDEKQQHYLYPEQGLDIFLNQDGKELLQYVAPREFELLLTPLLKPQGSQLTEE
jgi:hypothetical protein